MKVLPLSKNRRKTSSKFILCGNVYDDKSVVRCVMRVVKWRIFLSINNNWLDQIEADESGTTLFVIMSKYVHAFLWFIINNSSSPLVLRHTKGTYLVMRDVRDPTNQSNGPVRQIMICFFFFLVPIIATNQSVNPQLIRESAFRLYLCKIYILSLSQKICRMPKPSLFPVKMEIFQAILLSYIEYYVPTSFSHLSMLSI